MKKRFLLSLITIISSFCFSGYAYADEYVSVESPEIISLSNTIINIEEPPESIDKSLDEVRVENTSVIISSTPPELSMENGSGTINTGIYINQEDMSKRNAIVSYAKQFLGNPYVYGGTSLTNGADCSGFIMKVMEHFGIGTGRDSRSQAANCKKIDINSIKPGDVVFYADGNYINHVALYIGNSQVIHAASSDTGIIISDMNYREPYMAGSFLYI